MLKVIVSVPILALASRMACLNEPGPLSLALVTLNEAACTTPCDVASENTNTKAKRTPKNLFIFPPFLSASCCRFMCIIAHLDEIANGQ